MKSAAVKAFFSCSFRDVDKDINDFFRAICNGLDITCENVDAGYSELPPEKAKAMISGSDIVIAIAVARNKYDGSNDFSMPEAVSNEISMSYGFSKPLLIIRENTVRAEGFLNGYGTHLTFDRATLHSSEFIKRAVTSLHGVKLGSLSEHELALSQEVTEFVADRVSHLFELEQSNPEPIWSHSMQRTITFTKNYNRPIKVSRWNDYSGHLAADGKNLIEVEFEILKSSRNFDARLEYEERSPFGVTANIHLTPSPQPGDSLEYFISYRGPYLNPTFQEDLSLTSGITISGHRYSVFDGIVPVNRAKILEIQFRFPRDYKIQPSDAEFFVGSFFQDVEYLVESEIERAKFEKKNVGGKLEISARVTSPLLRHIYGIAWNPPARPKIIDETSSPQ